MDRRLPAGKHQGMPAGSGGPELPDHIPESARHEPVRTPPRQLRAFARVTEWSREEQPCSKL